MADTQEPIVTEPATPAAPAPDTTVTPSAPVETPAVVETPVAPIAPVEVAPAAEPVKPETETPPATESVLGDEKAAPKPEVKAEEAVKPDEKKVEPAKVETPTEVKPELPVYEPFKLQDGLSLDKEPLDAFTKILGEIETGKLDHLTMQAKGQELIDLASKATVESINRLNDHYVQIHENQKKEWFDAFKADPEMGGEKLESTVSALRDAVEQYAGSEQQVTEFRALMKETGVGNHPALTRLIYNMQQKINKYTTEGDGNRIVPGAKPAPSAVKDYQRFYTGANG